MRITLHNNPTTTYLRLVDFLKRSEDPNKIFLKSILYAFKKNTCEKIEKNNYLELKIYLKESFTIFLLQVIVSLYISLILIKKVTNKNDAASKLRSGIDITSYVE